ncbi:MAG: hypothetical protein PHC85_01530 [Candidatus Pacebacteria bacterium]|nr:hypothetical protein [Candidatus Paceibacterota bacterium]
MADKKEKPEEKPVVIGKLPSSLWWFIVLICLAVFFQRAYLIHAARTGEEKRKEKTQAVIPHFASTGVLKWKHSGKINPEQRREANITVAANRTRTDMILERKGVGRFEGKSLDGIVYEGSWTGADRHGGKFKLVFDSPNHAIGWHEDSETKEKIPTTFSLNG